MGISLTYKRVARAGGCALLACVLGIVQPSLPAWGQASEAAVKAAFLFNFLKFTEWPVPRRPANGEPYVMCFHAGSLAFDAVDAVNGKPVRDTFAQAVIFTETTALEDCHLIYVSEDLDPAAVDRLVALAHQRSILIVSDRENFARNGGMIALTRDGNRVRFEVNVESARRGLLVFSSKLLSLANIV